MSNCPSLCSAATYPELPSPIGSERGSSCPWSLNQDGSRTNSGHLADSSHVVGSGPRCFRAHLLEDSSLLPGGRSGRICLGKAALHPHLNINHFASCQPVMSCIPRWPRVLIRPVLSWKAGTQCADSPDRITEGAFLPCTGARGLCAFLLQCSISKEVFTF